MQYLSVTGDAGNPTSYSFTVDNNITALRIVGSNAAELIDAGLMTVRLKDDDKGINQVLIDNVPLRTLMLKEIFNNGGFYTTSSPTLETLDINLGNGFIKLGGQRYIEVTLSSVAVLATFDIESIKQGRQATILHKLSTQLMGVSSARTINVSDKLMMFFDYTKITEFVATKQNGRTKTISNYDLKLQERVLKDNIYQLRNNALVSTSSKYLPLNILGNKFTSLEMKVDTEDTVTFVSFINSL